MPYIKFVKQAPANHVCEPPKLGGLNDPKPKKGWRRPGLGSVWDCPVCHKWHTIVLNDDKYHEWQLLTDAEKAEIQKANAEADTNETIVKGK